MQKISYLKFLLVNIIALIFLVSIPISFHSYAVGPAVVSNNFNAQPSGTFLTVSIGPPASTSNFYFFCSSVLSGNLFAQGLTDTNGAKFINIFNATGQTLGGFIGGSSQCWYAPSTALVLDTITENYVSPITFYVGVYEVSGWVPSDSWNTANSSVGAVPGGVINVNITSASNSLFIGAFCANSVGSTWTPDSGFTLLMTPAFNCNQEYKSGLGGANPLLVKATWGTTPHAMEMLGVSIPSASSQTTLKVTAWNTIDPGTPTNWIVIALSLFFVPAIFWGAIKAFDAPPSTTVFTTLIALFFASVIAVIGGFELGANAYFPMAILIFNAGNLVIYIIRSRSRGF